MKKHSYIISVMIIASMMFSGCKTDFFPLEENPYKETETTVSVSEETPSYEEPEESFAPIETIVEITSETAETTEVTTTPETTTTPIETTTAETTTAETTTPAVTATAPQTTTTTANISLSNPSAQRKEIYGSYIYNNILTEKEKQAYDIFEGAAVSLSNKADFSGVSLTKAELERVVYAFDLYEPLYSYVDLENCMVRGRGGVVLSVDMAYYYDKATHSKMSSAAVSEADKILARITPSMSDYEILKLFHDEIITRCVYDKSAQNRDTIYGVLVERRATCTGYAKTFQYLCNRAGIENTCVFGDAGGEGHMWNLVKLDGEWYAVDTTWDDNTVDDIEGIILYEYFLTDSSKMANRTRFDYNYCDITPTGTKYYYYNVTGTYAATTADLASSIKNALKLSIKEKKNHAQIMCSDKNVTNAVIDLSNSGELFHIITETEKETGYTFDKVKMSYYTFENTNLILIIY